MESASPKTPYVYVLWSESGKRFYIGISEDPHNRLEQHNSGVFKAWTARHRPWLLVHTERYTTYAEARHRELELKRQKGGDGFFAKTGLDRSRFSGS